MKKNLLLAAALMASATMSAQLIGWTALEFGGTTTSAGTTTIRQALSNQDGEVFIVGQGGSVGDAPTLSLFGQEFATCPFEANQSQSNNNFIIAKTDKELQPLWTSVSNRGNFDNAFILQADIAAGKCTQGKQIESSTGIVAAMQLLTRGDSIYQYYYDWGQPMGAAHNRLSPL